MDPRRWRRLDELFSAALELRPAARAELVRSACGDDDALRDELLALLAAHEGPSMLDSPPPLPEAPRGTSEAAPLRALSAGAFLGPYEVIALLGAGGMGEVYRARDPRLGREVAIKLVRGTAPTRDALRRFDREARAAGALNHPNLLTVHDVGEQDGVPYVVTELLAGKSLRERLRHGPLPGTEALGLLRQALAGLTVAHASGIVHRDLKPENLFVTADGRLKILDFGLAKRLDVPAGSDETPTPIGAILGTMGYTAPELLTGRPPVPASDLFALGAVLYEMLGGRRAFDGPTPLAIMSAVLTEEPPPLLMGGAAADPALERLVRRCLAKRPEQRYGSAAELLADLDALPSSATSTAAP
jgi:serine/threonine protein kinase